MTSLGFSDGVDWQHGGTGANPLTDNVGISITNGSIPHDEPLVIPDKQISVDGKDPSDPTKTWVVNDTPPGVFVPLGTPIYFKFTVTNLTNVPAFGVTITDSFFGTPAAPTPPFPLWDPQEPDPLLGFATYEYVYGPITFNSLFPCVSDGFLVWGKGTYTTLPWTARMSVKLGTGTQVYGNVGSLGNIYANGGLQTIIHGAMVTDSNFGQSPSQVLGDYIVHNPGWPAVGPGPAFNMYFQPTFVPPPAWPAGPPIPDPLPNPNGSSATLTPGYYAAIGGGGGAKLTFDGSGTYFLDSLSLGQRCPADDERDRRTHQDLRQEPVADRHDQRDHQWWR